MNFSFPGLAVLWSLSALLLEPLSAAEPKPGASVFGEKKYIEYLPGDLPIVISSPHGGREKPEEIPTRESGVVQMDTNTQELARAIVAEFRSRTGHAPHLVVCRLHRQKLDCNREVVEAAAGDPVAEKAWNEYHGFIDQAVAGELAEKGRVFYIDLHGHGHPDRRLELGYLHSAAVLGKSATALNAPETYLAGSIRRLAEKSKLPYVELLRGPRSLGALLEAHGFPATPSPSRPVPNLPFFQGGYSVRQHAFTDAQVAGLQIECNFDGVRENAANREKFAAALLVVLREYLAEHFELRLPGK